MVRLAIAILVLIGVNATASDIPNEYIDYDAFASNVVKVGELRKQRRISEAQFIRMAREPGTVVLDARSAEKFAMLHIVGAKNLSLPDMTEEDLARVIPSKATRVLIYCNNNFRNEPVAFRTKIAPASLNVHTFNVLYSYGYTNVYELGPLIDIRSAKLKFEGSRQALTASAAR
jgi:hypothetical protein